MNHNKLATAALSLLIAIGLWLYVITTVSPGSKETFYNIPVVMENESVLRERGLMITASSSATVALELSGNRSDLAKVNSGNITLKADLSKVYEPGNQIPITYTVSFPGNVANNAFVTESKSPKEIFINVERRITKAIPVEVKWIGSVPEGFIADRENKFLEYPAIQITGPQSVTDQITKAIIEVDLNEQRESISQDYLYTLCDEEGEPIDAELIVTNVEEIHLEVKIQRVKDIALTYELIEGGGATGENAIVTLNVDTIRVAGSEAALEMLGDQLVVGDINLAEITSDCYKTFPILLEEGISNLTGITEVTANIRMRGLSTKDFLIQKIQAVNVPEGLEAELFTKELMLQVRGPVASISQLTSGDMKVSVDFANAEIGTSTFRVTVDFAEGFEQVGVLKADSVSASVTETNAQAEIEPVG